MGAFSSKSNNNSTSSNIKKVEVTAIDRAILDLKNSRDRLQRYRKKLEQDDRKLVQQAIKAKQCHQTQTAINILKLRKYKQQQVQTCEEQLLNIVQLVETIDSKRNEKQILDAMTLGKNTLKQMHEETTVEDVLLLMEQISEEHSVEQEMNDILTKNNSVLLLNNDLYSEEEIEAELEAMMNADKATTTTTSTSTPVEVLPTVPTDPLLPVAPDTRPNSNKTKVTEEGTQQEQQRIAVPG